MNTSDFKDLLVWQKSMDIVVQLYQLINMLPIEERFALADQMRRCSISIPSNIAEGHRRNSNKEFIQFLCISRGSIAELQTQLMLCHRLGYDQDNQASYFCSKLTEIDKMISSLIRSLKNPNS